MVTGALRQKQKKMTRSVRQSYGHWPIKDKNLLNHIKKNTKILKIHFLKTGFFQIPFLKSHNSVSF